MEVKLANYLDILIDEDINKITKCLVCLKGIENILVQIHQDILENKSVGSLSKFYISNDLEGMFHWKAGDYPIPIVKAKKLIEIWKEVCNKKDEDCIQLYSKMYSKTTYFTMQKSPIPVKAIKVLSEQVSYLIGILYSDGALRNLWLTKINKDRFVYEITITDESKEHLENIDKLFFQIFGISTKVKSVENGRWYRLLFNSAILFRLLNKLFQMPVGYKKEMLHIPEIIKKSNEKIQLAFVKGFFDGDGTCSLAFSTKRFTPIVSVSQSSKPILQEINNVLYQQGMTFQLYKKFNNGFEHFVLETKSKQIIKSYNELVGFEHPKKKSRLKELINHFNNKSKAATPSDQPAYLEGTL